MACSHPGAASYRDAAQRPLGCAVLREQHKESKHGADVRGAGNSFVPWVFETYGAMGPRGRDLFQQFVAEAEFATDGEEELTEEQERWLRAGLSYQWQQLFSVALQRANARIILAGARRARDLIGQRVYAARSRGDFDAGD